MRLKPSRMNVIFRVSAAAFAVGAILLVGSPSRAAEDGRFVPAKRQVNATDSTSPAKRGVVVRVISVPLQECPADDSEAMNGVKAFIDPATGELRAPTPEEEAALARAIGPRLARRAESAREAQVLPNGIVAYEIGEDGMQDVVVRTGPDGKPVFFCTPRSETPKALTRPLAPKKSEAGAEEK